jgi:hypothetical protein
MRPVSPLPQLYSVGCKSDKLTGSVHERLKRTHPAASAISLLVHERMPLVRRLLVALTSRRCTACSFEER